MVATRAPDRPARSIGRDAGFRAVYEREFDYVWTSLRRLGVQASDLEDVAQEVFVRVHRRLLEYDPARPIRPWLFAFAVRCAADWRRRPWRRAEVTDLRAEPVAVSVNAEAALDRADDVALVQRALDHVEVDRRAVFILYELDECPMKEIAQSLDIPLFTAYSRLRLARKEFAVAARRLLCARGER